MYIETSAIVAMVLEEPDSADLIDKVHANPRCETSVVNAFETVLSVGKVIGSYKNAKDIVPEFLKRAGIKVIGVETDIYDELVTAYLRFGKGTGHPAQLNFGDCFSYALAKRKAVPLLFKGSDFAATDIDTAS